MKMKVELKQKMLATLIASALGLSMAGAVQAADTAGSKSTSAASEARQGMAASTGSSSHATEGYDIRASKLIGSEVRNAQGEKLGKIDDLVVDVNNERVYYAVLAHGGAMGMGGKLFAYPVSLLQPGKDKDEVVLNVDKEKLKAAPGFERSKWPSWGNDDRYRGEVDRYFGPTVIAKAMPNERLIRASTLIGKDIDDKTGKDAGEIKDLVVSLGTNKVHYAVVDFDKAWSAEDKLIPLSLRALGFPNDVKKDAVINVTRDQLDMTRGFDEKHWPDLNDPTYQRNIDNYLRTAPGATASRAG